jgi:hypothetical protein
MLTTCGGLTAMELGLLYMALLLLLAVKLLYSLYSKTLKLLVTNYLLRVIKTNLRIHI